MFNKKETTEIFKKVLMVAMQRRIIFEELFFDQFDSRKDEFQRYLAFI